MADVAPAKVNLRHFTFVIPVHRFVEETTVRQFKVRSRVSQFPRQVQQPEHEDWGDGMAHAGNPISFAAGGAYKRVQCVVI
jgi:hypothetical protein